MATELVTGTQELGLITFDAQRSEQMASNLCHRCPSLAPGWHQNGLGALLRVAEGKGGRG